MTCRLRWIVLVASFTWASICLAAPDAQALIGRLARSAPSNIAFIEARFSPLLVAPIIVAGELAYGGPQSLDRHVNRPYAENTQIRGESVRIERDGEPTRTFALRRAPELRGFLTGLVGLLGGDGAFIEEHFGITAGGDDAAWSLALAPVDAKLRQRLRQILVYGNGSEPRCFSMLDTAGGASVMLLGPAANRTLSPDVTLKDVLVICGAQ